MIPSCPQCGADEIFDREILGAYKKYQTLFRLGVVLILFTLVGIILLVFSKLAIVLIIVAPVGATMLLIKANNVKVAEMYCNKCNWQEKH